MHIPNIGFNHHKTNQAELEIIELSALEQAQHTDHAPQLPHRVNFFLLIYIEHGEGKHWVDFKEYAYQAGSVIFVQREQVHAFDFSNMPKGKVLIFTQAFLDNVHTNMRLPNYTPTHLNHLQSPILTLDDQNNRRTKTLIEEMTTEIGLEHRDPLIVMYLFCSLALLHRRLQPKENLAALSQTQSQKFARLFELLQSNFQRVRDANWYAQQLAITYKTLNQICKIATNMTAKQMIDAFTIIEIKRRLVVSNVTSQQLTYDFGFDDASNFLKYFKKETGLTPSQFQKIHTTPVL
ncbi:helix-turn-helix transcriptional regulator [Enterovibrio sp. FF113]|uniref:AraC family transcriptional regulator n=1 Tax=Enterovibrio sp. FF113 TaxID=3230010 RepID=UPI00352E1BE8